VTLRDSGAVYKCTDYYYYYYYYCSKPHVSLRTVHHRGPAAKWLICRFSQCYNTRILTAKLSPYYFTYLLHNLRFKIEQQQDLLQTIRLFISEWDERYDWLRTTAEHDVVWSMWAGDCGELSCAHLNGEWQFYTKAHELIGAFLACPPWLSKRYSTNTRRTRSTAGWFPQLAERLYPSLADCRCFQVSNPNREIRETAFVHHTALTEW